MSKLFLRKLQTNNRVNLKYGMVSEDRAGDAVEPSHVLKLKTKPIAIGFTASRIDDIPGTFEHDAGIQFYDNDGVSNAFVGKSADGYACVVTSVTPLDLKLERVDDFGSSWLFSNSVGVHKITKDNLNLGNAVRIGVAHNISDLPSKMRVGDIVMINRDADNGTAPTLGFIHDMNSATFLNDGSTHRDVISISYAQAVETLSSNAGGDDQDGIIQELQQQLAEAQQTVENLRNQNDAKDQTVSTLSADLVALRAEKESLVGEAEGLKSTIASLREENAALEEMSITGESVDVSFRITPIFKVETL